MSTDEIKSNFHRRAFPLSFFALALSFITLSLSIRPEPTAFDHYIAHLIGPAAQASHSAWTRAFWSDVTVLGSGPLVTLIVSLVLGYLVLARHHKAALVIGLCILAAAMSVYLLKGLYERPRPRDLSALIGLDIYSFPSGHSVISGATYPILSALMARVVEGRRLKSYCIGCGIFLMTLIGISRVYLGVHFATDILAGWTVGLAWALFSWFLLERLQQKGLVESAPVAEEVEDPSRPPDTDSVSISPQ